MTKEEFFAQQVLVVPSINVLFPDGQPVTYSLISSGYIGLAHGLCKSAAEHLAAVHNAHQKMRGLLMAANRYVQAYADTDANHPQAQDIARSLVADINSNLT